MILKLSNIIDTLFKSVLFFLLFVVVLRMLRINFTLSLIVSGILVFAVLIFLQFLNDKKLAKNNLKASEQKEVAALAEQFLFGTKTEVQNYFVELFKKIGSVSKNSTGLCLKLKEHKYYIIPQFSKRTLGCDEIIEIYKNTKTKGISAVLILCIGTDSACSELIQRFTKQTYSILSVQDIYAQLCKPQNFFPSIEIENIIKEKLTFKKIRQFAFDRKKSKTYFWCGLVLFLSSFFVFFGIYYLVFAGVLFTFSLICLFRKNSKPIPSGLFDSKN